MQTVHSRSQQIFGPIGFFLRLFRQVILAVSKALYHEPNSDFQMFLLNDVLKERKNSVV